MNSVGRDFVEHTKYQNLRKTEEGKDPVQPPLQAEWPADAPLVDLPEPAPTMPQAADFLRLAEGRTSVRRYSPGQLSQANLAYLRILKLDGEAQFAVYLASLGRKLE